MKKKLFYFFILLFTFNALHGQQPRNTMPFDNNWKFYLGDNANAEKENFNDKNWRTLSLPHDWSIEDVAKRTADDTLTGPFSKKSAGGTATGYTVGGTAWYRKHFVVSGNGTKNVSIYFDGVYMNSDVWVNGNYLGNHPYGYTAFGYDITAYLKPEGQENNIAVRVRNGGRTSRWYSGSGIYRHVWLVINNPVHIKQWGVTITTPQVSAATSTIVLKTNLISVGAAGKVKLKTQIIDKSGKTVAITEKVVDLKDTDEITQRLAVKKPRLWSPEKPYLYQAITTITLNNKLIDRVSNTFGIRSIEFSAQKGFLLNGVKTLLKGGCVHHDNGPLGSAAIDRAEERKVELLKSFGYNAVRTSHNPPSQQFLDACDRLGLLVIDEAFDQWEKEKNTDDYHLYFNKWWQRDIDAMVCRDRNHPSIIMWSIGNEIRERVDSSGIVIAKKLADEVHLLDATRPVTQAICFLWEHPKYTWDSTATAFSQMDIAGYNYQWAHYDDDHTKYPKRIMTGTETYPKEALENWNQAEQHPWVIGDFVWTAMDYMGETGIGHTEPDSIKTFTMPSPWFNAYCGDIDLIGGKKPQSWYRDIVWHRSKMAILVHAPFVNGHKEAVSDWGWPDEYPSWNFAGNEGKPLQVNVYSRGFTAIVLKLNGKKVDEKQVSGTGITTTFNVKYAPGLLTAIGLTDHKATDSVKLQTTDKPYKIRLIADRSAIKANPNDLCYVTAEIVDAQGRVIPDAVMPLSFSIAGMGEIIATGNADPKDMASFQKPVRRTFGGRCLVIIRPKGKAGSVTLTAKNEMLADGVVSIKTK